MEITNTLREKIYHRSPAMVKAAHGDLEIGDQLQEIAQKYQLSKQTAEELVRSFGDHILGLFDKNTLPGLLEKRLGVTPESAQQIATDLLSLVDSIEGLGEAVISDPIETLLGQEEHASSEEHQEEQSRETLSEEERRTIQETSFLPHSVQEETPEQKSEQSEPAAEGYNKPETKSEAEEREEEAPSATPSYAKPLTDIPRYDNTYEDPYHEKPD